jgi:hypothetical protein
MCCSETSITWPGSPRSLPEGREDASDEGQRRRVIAHAGTLEGGRRIRLVEQIHEAGPRPVARVVERRCVGLGPDRPEARQPRDDQPRAPGVQRGRIEAEPGEPRGQHVGQKHVRPLDQAPQRRGGLRQRQVERNRALAAVVHVEVRGEGEVAREARETRQAVTVELAPRHLDLDHLGAQVGEQRAGRRRRHEARQLDDADSRERGRHGAPVGRTDPAGAASALACETVHPHNRPGFPMQELPRKPLRAKSYGSIPHLPGSRLGPGDHACHEGHARIATERPRDRHDQVLVQEKLDGSNVAVALLDGTLHPLTRAGYAASTSPFEQHWRFAEWVFARQDRFLAVLREGERLCGEWLMQAHGTRYRLGHEPFVVFDLMVATRRTPYDELVARVAAGAFTLPALLHRGAPLSIGDAMARLGDHGHHGALDRAEGVVWRVERAELVHPGRGSERRRRVDFLAKYVRPEKVDGCYLPELTGQTAVWNWRPDGD